MTVDDHHPRSEHADGRLVLVSGRDPLRTSGGSESYVVGHAKAAMLAGYEPHVFSIGRRSALIETDFGILHRVGSPILPARSITSVLQRPWLVPPIVELLKGLPGPHVVHGYGAWADIVVNACRRLARRGVRAVPIATIFSTIEHEASAKLSSTVVSGHPHWLGLHRLELAWARLVTRPVERRAYRSAWRLVVNYDSIRSLLERTYGPMPICKLPYSPPTAFEEPSVHGRDRRLERLGDPAAGLIVSVSRHDGRKGLDTLIAALLELRDAGIAFRACLVGPGLLLSAHRRWIESLRLDSQVLLPGRVPNVMPYLISADIYVLPSHEEACGSVAVLEALQAGSAIVASNVDGIPEDLRDGHNALLVAPGNVESLKGAIVRLLVDPELRARLGAAARETYEARFAPQVTARALADLYAQAGLPAARPVRIASAA